MMTKMRKTIAFGIGSVAALLLASEMLAANPVVPAPEAIRPRCSVVFRYDDYRAGCKEGNARTTEDTELFAAERRLFEAFRQLHMRVVVAVIPFTRLDDEVISIDQDPVRRDYLRQLIHDGIAEIALHGYLHTERKVEVSSPRRRWIKTEFRGQDFAIQRAQMLEGKEILERALHTRIRTFVPPYNSFDDNTLAAMRACGLEILSASVRYESAGWTSDGAEPTAESASRLLTIPCTGEAITFVDYLTSTDNYDCEIDQPTIVVLHPFDLTGGTFASSQSRTVPPIGVDALVQLLEKVNQLGADFRVVGLEGLADDSPNSFGWERYAVAVQYDDAVRRAKFFGARIIPFRACVGRYGSAEEYGAALHGVLVTRLGICIVALLIGGGLAILLRTAARRVQGTVFVRCFVAIHVVGAVLVLSTTAHKLTQEPLSLTRLAAVLAAMAFELLWFVRFQSKGAIVRKRRAAFEHGP